MDHGTPQMYRKELRDGDEPCDECRAAQAKHVAEYRQSKPPRDRSAETAQATARRRALNRLAEQYPGTFQSLLAEEQRRVGV